MNYIGYMNQLWRSALVEPMPASEIALYAFIPNRSLENPIFVVFLVTC